MRPEKEETGDAGWVDEKSEEKSEAMEKDGKGAGSTEEGRGEKTGKGKADGKGEGKDERREDWKGEEHAAQTVSETSRPLHAAGNEVMFPGLVQAPPEHHHAPGMAPKEINFGYTESVLVPLQLLLICLCLYAVYYVSKRKSFPEHMMGNADAVSATSSEAGDMKPEESSVAAFLTLTDSASLLDFRVLAVQNTLANRLLPASDPKDRPAGYKTKKQSRMPARLSESAAEEFRYQEENLFQGMHHWQDMAPDDGHWHKWLAQHHLYKHGGDSHPGLLGLRTTGPPSAGILSEKGPGIQGQVGDVLSRRMKVAREVAGPLGRANGTDWGQATGNDWDEAADEMA